MAARVHKTPVGQSILARRLSSPGEFISPSTRRSFGVLSPAGPTPLPTENDDEAEIRERRRSRVLEMQRRHAGSPSTRTPGTDRQISTPLGTVSNNQLSEHYASCIKLSAENKINAKNAFGLHLIDYMSELLRKKDMSNFQVASSTLDASTKIYAGRVDAIHSETYKVLSGLGRGKDDKDEDGAIEEGGEGDNTAPKKKKRRGNGRTIETNLKNINMNKLDLEFEVDPLFHKTSAAFDEGGTGGLLINHLHCRDDSSELILDSNMVMFGHQREEDLKRSKYPIELRELKDLYRGVQLDCLQICPQFADFEFTNWNRDGQDSFSLQSLVAKSSHAFDLDAEPEPIADTASSVGDPFDLGAMSDYDNDAASECPTEEGRSDQLMLTAGKEAVMVKNAMEDIKHGSVGTLMQILAAETGEYSYFNSNLLRTWAGPDHWKLLPKSKDALAERKKTKDKKEVFTLDYEEDVNFDRYFRETRAATTLTKATLR